MKARPALFIALLMGFVSPVHGAGADSVDPCSLSREMFRAGLGTPVVSLSHAYPNAHLVMKDGVVREVRVTIDSPVPELQVTSARVTFGVKADAVVYIQATLRGNVTYDDLAAYLTGLLGKPNGIHQSLYRSWWGNNYCRVGAGWHHACGSSLTIEGPTLGHRLALMLSRTDTHGDDRPPNNGSQPTVGAPSMRASCSTRTLRAAGG